MTYSIHIILCTILTLVIGCTENIEPATVIVPTPIGPVSSSHATLPNTPLSSSSMVIIPISIIGTSSFIPIDQESSSESDITQSSSAVQHRESSDDSSSKSNSSMSESSEETESSESTSSSERLNSSSSTTPESSSSDTEPEHTLTVNDSMFVLFKEDGIPPDSADYYDSKSFDGHIGFFTDKTYVTPSLFDTITDPTTDDGTTAFRFTGTQSWGGIFFAFGETFEETRDLSYWHNATLYFDIKANFIPLFKFEWGEFTSTGSNVQLIWLNSLGLDDDNEWTTIAIPLADYIPPKQLKQMRIVANFMKVTTGEYVVKFDDEFTSPHLRKPVEKPIFFLDNVYIGGKPVFDCIIDALGAEYCREVEE
ncbi:MAG: hypothetical protein OCC49_19300 [Fibrobacterales bacterium]